MLKIVKYKNKICFICGCSFVPSSPTQRVCSCSDCQTIYRRKSWRKRKTTKKHIRICLVCNKEFQTTDSRRKYCGSIECEKERLHHKNRRSEEKRKGTRGEEKRKYREQNLSELKEKAKQRYRAKFRDREVRGGWDSTKLSYSFVSEYVKSRGYTLVSDSYINNNSKLDLICGEGHRWSVSFHNFKDMDQNCPVCVGRRFFSGAEKNLYDFVVSIMGNSGLVIFRDRSLIYPYELDIYIPSANIAIEYCGLYWHSEISGGKKKDYHYNKMISCKEKKVRLITIFEDEYLNKPEVVKSRIRNALNKPEKRIYARKCILKEIGYRESKEFLDRYHLQGSGVSKARWGLFSDNILVQVLTCGEPARKHTSKKLGRVLEIKRFATKVGVSVVGGFGKLFSVTKKFALENEYDVIKSYCDMRYASEVPVYEKLGFILYGFTKYTPHYCNKGHRVRNQSLRKTKEEKKTGLTEWELRRAQGFDRIFDCGHRTYVYNLRGFE